MFYFRLQLAERLAEEERLRKEEEEQRKMEEEQLRLLEEAKKAEEERLLLAIEVRNLDFQWARSWTLYCELIFTKSIEQKTKTIAIRGKNKEKQKNKMQKVY